MSSASASPAPPLTPSRAAKRSLGVMLPPSQRKQQAEALAAASSAASALSTPSDTPVAPAESSLSHRNNAAGTAAASRSHALAPHSLSLTHSRSLADDDEAEAERLDLDDELEESAQHRDQQAKLNGLIGSASDSAATAASASKLFWMRVCAWVALLVAVFSMAAVGPMFLYLEKRSIRPLLAVLWRQSMQIVCLLVPTAIEYRMLKPNTREWWKQRVSLTSDTKREERARAERKARAKEDAERAARDQVPLSSPRESDSILPTRIDVAPTNGDSLVSLAADAEYDATTMHPAALQPPLTGRHSVWALTIVSFCWFTSVSLWVLALPYTSAARASLFSSLYPLFIICFMRLWHKVPVSLGEFVGVVVCILGIASSEWMAAADPDLNTIAAVEAAAAQHAAAVAHNGTAMATGSDAAADSASLAHLQFLGDGLCVLGSLFIACNVVEAAPTRRVIPLFSFTLASSSIVWCFLFLSTVFFEGSSVSSPFDPVVGVFGFLASGEMFLRIALFGLVVGMVGLLGFNFAVSIIHPIVFSSVQLLDPGLSGIISALAGVEDWPVASTYLGVAIVTAGIFIVVYYQAQREAAQALEAKAKAAAEAQGIVVLESPRRSSTSRPPRKAYARVVTNEAADPDEEDGALELDELPASL